MKKTRPDILFLLAVLLPLLFAACGGKRGNSAPAQRSDLFGEAVFIRGSLVDSATADITIVNPWDSSQILSSYRLSETPGSGTPQGTTPLQLPLRRLIVYSSIHAALLAELGYADAIAGVADARYIKTPAILERLADGRIADIGSSMEPSLEKIIALRPDAILLSPYQNAGHGVADKAGIPVIDCADYMETTPLGRAEWSKFFSMLVEGVDPAKNNRLFDGVRERYDSLALAASRFKDRPLVITELPQQGMWTMPGGNSYAARLLLDAGASYPFADDSSTGSTTMNYEKVFDKARDADFWLIKSFGPAPTKTELSSLHPFNSRIKAFRDGGIYNANTSACNLFEEFPFHPDLLLEEYISIFHQTGAPLRYFAPLPD